MYKTVLQHLGSIGHLLHTSGKCSAVDKQLLAKLRKKTGYSMSLCKKALEEQENNIESALEWLEKEAKALGLAKAANLIQRKTTQGLIGVNVEGKQAVMVEMNCETDFVARNNIFKDLVSNVTKTLLDCNRKQLTDPDELCKEFFFTEQLANLQMGNQSLSDLAAITISSIGENITLTRAVRLHASSGIDLFGCTHPVDPRNLGKYGSVIAIRNPSRNIEIPHQLCLHIIGMNPTSIGTADDTPAENPDEECILIHQEFLPDPTVTVSEVLEESRIEIIDFVRFECGEITN